MSITAIAGAANRIRPDVTVRLTILVPGSCIPGKVYTVHAVYLLPDALAEGRIRHVQQALRDALGVEAAARLPVHVTVKGFFASDADDDEVRRAFDGIETASLRSAPLAVGAVVTYGTETVALQLGRSASGTGIEEWLRDLHGRVLDQMLPLVAPGCAFTEGEWLGDRWDPHITLASHDVDADLCARAVSVVGPLVAERPLGFPTLALVRVRAAEWSQWWRDFEIATLPPTIRLTP